jgi:hypothetical protein
VSKTDNYALSQLLLSQHNSYVSSIQFGSPGRLSGPRPKKKEKKPGRAGRDHGGDGRQLGRPGREDGGPGHRAHAKFSRDSLLTAALLDMTRPAGEITDNSLTGSEGRVNKHQMTGDQNFNLLRSYLLSTRVVL